MKPIELLLSEPIVQRLGWTLLHFVWQGAAVAAVLGLLLLILRARSANVRYVVACAAMLAMVAMETRLTSRFRQSSAKASSKQ